MKSFEAQVYIDRRKQLKENLGKGQLLLIGNQESGMNFKDNWYHFRQDSTLLYYTGIDKPNVHLVIDIEEDSEVLYGDELTIDDIVWTGPLPQLNEIAHNAGIKSVLPLKSLSSAVSQTTMFLPPYRPEHNILISILFGIQNDEIQSNVSIDLIKAIVSQRNIKEKREVLEMEKAVIASYDMHLAVMKGVKCGMSEHDLVGIASKIAYQHNTVFSYPAILTKRGEVLHNHDHTGVLEENDMVLYDGGCESPLYYAGDITRTFPVNGTWTTIQKELYNVVYNAFREGVNALRPGISFKEVHLLACRVLVDGLKTLGFMKGDVDDAVANGAHTMFFQCGLGHMIGLDVHDMENLGEQYVGYGDNQVKSKEFGLKSLRLGRSLEAGFGITVEPGIYIIPSLIDLRRSQGMYKDFINYEILEKHRNFGGIRLEDNFIITESGSHLLGAQVQIPRTATEVEEFMIT